MPGKGIQWVCFLLFLVGVSVWFSSYLYQSEAAWTLGAQAAESDAFRQMNFSERTLRKLSDAVGDGLSPGEILTALYPFCRNRVVYWPERWENSALFAWKSTLLKKTGLVIRLYGRRTRLYGTMSHVSQSRQEPFLMRIPGCLSVPMAGCAVMRGQI